MPGLTPALTPTRLSHARRREHIVHPVRCFPSKCWDDMGVGVQSGGNVGMTETFLNNLGVDRKQAKTARPYPALCAAGVSFRWAVHKCADLVTRGGFGRPK